MKLYEIMTPNPITLRPCQSGKEVTQLFLDHQMDGAPVVDEDGNVIGLFTKSHIYRMVCQGIDMLTPIEKFMTRRVYTGHPNDEFGEVVNATIPRLPVVDQDGRPVGMITRGDIAKAFFDSYHNISIEYDTIINSTHNMIISVDEKGVIKVWNSSAEKLLCRRADDVIGKDILEVLPNSGLMDIIETGRIEPLQKVKLNNRFFISNRSPIKKDGKIIGAVAVLQDISEIEKVSSELEHFKELNKELDAIIDSSFDGLYITDGDGLTLRLNKAFERINGISANKFLGRLVVDIEAEGIVSESVSALVLNKRKAVTIIQEVNGKTTLVTGNPVFDEAGNIFRVVCNVRDITELNKLKQKLEEVQGLSQHYESQLRNLRMQYTGSNKMIVNSAKMKSLLDTVMRLAQFDSTILVTGESGTGKELIAETIHRNSQRSNGPFIKVNCGAIPENLLESELFGYDYGAFTGAKKEGKAGYFQLANGGTIFLDEIGDMPYNLQVKLLRVLQNREIVRVGGVKSLPIDVRIVTGTNRNLWELVEKKMLREDLYYRLNVVPVQIPPLRERKEDIPALVLHFMQMYNRKHKLHKTISPEMVEIFMGYSWPGNVRELENLIERLLVITPQDVLSRDDLPPHMGEGILEGFPEVFVSGIIPLQYAVESLEKQILEKAYAKCHTTRQIAKELEVAASTVVRKAAKYGINQSKAR